MKKLFLFFLLSALPVFSQMEIPKGAKDCEFIKHSHFSLCYDEEHEQARWVAYELTKEEIFGNTIKKNNFDDDIKVSTGSAQLTDYKGSGYSRGHLAPAADFKFNQKAVDESFYLSNISPQIQNNFNGAGGIWFNLEMAQRNWVQSTGNLYIVVGPVLTNGLRKLRNSKVSIPNAFYKAFLVYNGKEVKAIGFLIPHKASKESYFNFAVSIDQLESLLGFDLFSELPDNIENAIESKVDIPSWQLTNVKQRRLR